jgi:hypothetical protein
LDLDKFAAAGFAPPRNLTACIVGSSPTCTGTTAQLSLNRLDWKTPVAGRVVSYTILRSLGSTFTLTGLKVYTLNGTAGAPPPTTFIDPEKLQNKVFYTYAVKANFSDSKGGTGTASNRATIMAVTSKPK